METPPKTYQTQLEAAYLAIDVLTRDRARLGALLSQATVATRQDKETIEHYEDELDKIRSAYTLLSKEFADSYLITTRLSALRGLETQDTRKNSLAAPDAASAEEVVVTNAAFAAAEYEARLNAIYASRSWRITRPLRGAICIFRALKRAPTTFKKSSKVILRKLFSGAYYVLRMSTIGAIRIYGRGAKWWRMTFGTPRTVWGVTPILTLPVLAKCDRLLGLRSNSLVFTTYYIAQNFDINLKKISEYVYSKHPSWIGAFHAVVFRIALTRFDVFHYFCDRGILLPTRRIEINENEMRAIIDAGHKLYTYTYGADVRTRQTTLELGKYNFCSDCPEPMKFCTCDDLEGSANIARIRNYATEMLALGDMVHYVPGARNFHFWPLDLDAIAYVGCGWLPDRPLRIAHAPNHSHFKGSHHLVEAIEKLVANGRQVELVRVSGVPNREALKLFAECDIVADQFIGGAPGYAALEAMATGKPVLCYIRNEGMVVDPRHCPIINTNPDTLYETLSACLDGKFDLAEIGRRGRNYVEHHYSLNGVAVRLGKLYLETACFPGRINRRISKNVEKLEAKLPQLIVASPPIPLIDAAAIRSSGIKSFDSVR